MKYNADHPNCNLIIEKVISGFPKLNLKCNEMVISWIIF
jgi:hypothetical protein